MQVLFAVLGPLVSIGRWVCFGAILILTVSYKALLFCAGLRKLVVGTIDRPTPMDDSVAATDDCAGAGSLTTLRLSIATNAAMYKRVWLQFCGDDSISTTWPGKIRLLVACDWQVRLIPPPHAPSLRVAALGCSAVAFYRTAGKVQGGPQKAEAVREEEKAGGQAQERYRAPSAARAASCADGLLGHGADLAPCALHNGRGPDRCTAHFARQIDWHGALLCAVAVGAGARGSIPHSRARGRQNLPEECTGQGAQEGY